MTAPSCFKTLTISVRFHPSLLLTNLTSLRTILKTHTFRLFPIAVHPIPILAIPNRKSTRTHPKRSTSHVKENSPVYSKSYILYMRIYTKIHISSGSSRMICLTPLQEKLPIIWSFSSARVKNKKLFG